MIVALLVRLVPEVIHEWLSVKSVTAGERSHSCAGHLTVADVEAAMAAVDYLYQTTHKDSAQ